MEDKKSAGNPPEKRKFDIAREIYEWADAVVFAFVGLVLVFAFLAGFFYVNLTSMQDTLKDGEMMMVSRLPYNPRHGDIVIFSKHGFSFNEATGQYNTLVKRVIGLPGDTLEFKDGTLYINDIAQEEPYIRESNWIWRGDMPNPVTVPEDKVFVLGDNRNVSQDSRNSQIGFVETRSVLGRVILRLTPLNKFGPVA
jgi:signal peptidase I